MMYEDYYDEYYEDYDAYAAAYEAEMAAQAEAEAVAAMEAEMQAEYEAMMAAEAEAEMQAEAEAAEAEEAEYIKQRFGLWPEEIEALAKAKEEGRLIILPCKIGDTVYKTDLDGIITGTVLYAHLYGSFMELTIDWDDEYFETIQADSFGKTVFASKEEAEKALKGDK